MTTDETSKLKRTETINPRNRFTIQWIFNVIVLIILPIFCIIGLLYNLSQGYFFTPPFHLNKPVVMETFKSEIDELSISYPKGWSIYEFPQGNHGDMEALALINPGPCLRCPFVEIAHTTIAEPSLEEVAKWGESRIAVNNYTSISLEEVNIKDKAVLQRTYTYLIDSPIPLLANPKRRYCYHFYFLNGLEAYTIKMCAQEENFAELDPVFKNMIQTVSFE